LQSPSFSWKGNLEKYDLMVNFSFYKFSCFHASSGKQRLKRDFVIFSFFMMLSGNERSYSHIVLLLVPSVWLTQRSLVPTANKENVKDLS
jgi:hypothetical protein